jgi:hypothetical protein
MFIRRVSPSSPTRVIQYIFCNLCDKPIALFTSPSRGRISVDASVERGFFFFSGSKAAKFVCAIQTSHKCDFWCVSSLLSQPAARNETFIPAYLSVTRDRRRRSHGRDPYFSREVWK